MLVRAELALKGVGDHREAIIVPSGGVAQPEYGQRTHQLYGAANELGHRTLARVAAGVQRGEQSCVCVGEHRGGVVARSRWSAPPNARWRELVNLVPDLREHRTPDGGSQDLWS